MSVQFDKVNGDCFTWRGTFFQRIRPTSLKIPRGARLYIFNLTKRSQQYLHNASYVDPNEAKKWRFPFGQIILLHERKLNQLDDWLESIVHEIGHHLAWKLDIIPNDIGQEEQQANELGKQWYKRNMGE